MIVDAGEFIRDDSGFFVYWPEKAQGCYASYVLRWIADELDRLNAPIQAELEAYFAANPSSCLQIDQDGPREPPNPNLDSNHVPEIGGL